MANKNIGQCPCPICDKTASVRETKKDKAYIMCDDCGFQGFARGYSANKLLRERMQAMTQPTAEPLPMVTVNPAIKKQPAATPATPAPVEKTQQTTETAPKRELTIFDKEFYTGAKDE